MKIVILTGGPKGRLLESLVNDGRKISAVVVPKSKKYRSRFEPTLKSALFHQIPIIFAPPQSLADSLKDVDYTLLLSCGWPFLIPESVFSKVQIAVNIHPSLLPKYRGKYLHYILINQEKQTGVTAHVMTNQLDAGPIIDQHRFDVSPFDTVKSLLRKCSEAEIPLVKSVLRQIEEDKMKATPQNEKEATIYVNQRTPEDSEIDPEKPLKDLFYEIRACDPNEYPAFFEIEGQKVYVRLWRKDKPPEEEDMI